MNIGEFRGYAFKDELDNKADEEDLSRSSTIVIANYDSHENSKKSADIVIEEGENASIKINKAIQSLEGTGGEVKLMEGKYQLDSKISILVDNITLSGVGKATKLIARDLPAESRGSLVEVGKDLNEDNNQVKGFTVCDLVVDGNNTEENYRGVGLWGAVDSTISNVVCSNNKSNGIGLYNDSSTTISNVECSNNESNGIQVSNDSSATISNVKCIDNGTSGIATLKNSSATISNVECSNSGYHGIQMSNDSSATISNVECSNNEVNGIGVFGDSSATISNVRYIDNVRSGIVLDSSSSEISLSSSTLINNNTNDVTYPQLQIGRTPSRNPKYVFVSNCKIVDTVGETIGVSILGDNHVFINNQFIGEFKEKINDKGNNSTVRDNVGV